jgi:hypothetical protein
MQPKRNHPFKILLLAFLPASMHAVAQQPPANQPAKNILPAHGRNDTYRAVYAFNVITGANSTYGFEVLRNGVVVLRQPAEVSPTQAIVLKSAIQAQRAAMFVIYKMKNNIQPVTLTNEELKKVTIN